MDKIALWDKVLHVEGMNEGGKGKNDESGEEKEEGGEVEEESRNGDDEGERGTDAGTLSNSFIVLVEKVTILHLSLPFRFPIKHSIDSISFSYFRCSPPVSAF